MASTLTKVLTLARTPLNAVSFAGRQRLAWERGAPRPRNQDKEDLFSYLRGSELVAADAREAELRRDYGLEPLRVASTQHDYRDNLYLVDALERLFEGVEAPAGRELRALDVGAQHWNYVFGLERFWRSWTGSEEVELTGIEVDGHGIYPDLYSRVDHARAHARRTGNPRTHYAVADFLDTERVNAANLDVVTLFYPFVSRYSLLRWGLPLRYFQPDDLLARAVSVLRPGGFLVVFNQVPVERDVAVEMAMRAGAAVERTLPLQSTLVAYWERTLGRCATLLRASGR